MSKNDQQDSQLDILFQRAYERATTGRGGLSKHEIASVAAHLQTIDHHTRHMTRMRILGYAGASEYAYLLEPFLEGPDAQLAWTALTVLCNYWDLTPQYVAQLVKFIRGVAWDDLASVQESAIAIAQEHLGKHYEAPLLQALVDTCRDEATEDSAAELACRGLDEVFGYPSVPRSAVVQMAMDRLLRDRH